MAKKQAINTVVPQDMEEIVSQKLADMASDESKNQMTLADKNRVEMSMNSDVVLPDTNDAPVYNQPEPENNGLDIGDIDQKVQLSLVPKIAGKVRLCSIKKTEEYEELTTTTITFDRMMLNSRRVPVKVQYRSHRVYVNGPLTGETRISPLRTATTNGIVDRVYFESEKTRDMSIVTSATKDILPELAAFAYRSIVAGFERLDNAIRHVTKQALAGEKLVGHDETLRATTSKFLLKFAKAVIKAEKTPMSDAEFEAKARAAAAQAAEMLRKETEN